MDSVDPAGQPVALPLRAARGVAIAQKIRRAAKYALLLKPGHRAIDHLNELVQVLNRVDRARTSIARLGQVRAQYGSGKVHLSSSYPTCTLAHAGEARCRARQRPERAGSPPRGRA
jgi:hypothetical protein